jgi:hypothetical protein
VSGRYDQRSQVTPRRPDGGRDTVRSGPYIGPIRLTATRVFIGVALAGSIGYLAYAFTVRDANQIPLLASGAAILGTAFLALALAGLVRAYQAGKAGAGGRSFVAALGGGLALLIAFGAFATAAILALLWRG